MKSRVVRDRSGQQDLTRPRAKETCSKPDQTTDQGKEREKALSKEEIQEVKSTRNFILAQVGKNRNFYNVLIDSGAGVSCVMKKVVERERLPLTSLTDRDCKFLNTANNEKMKVLGKTVVNIYVDQVEFAMPCYVLEELAAAIIVGVDVNQASV